MIKNYFKMAWKVLQRRKFFTFVSLFGISITLMVLILFTSVLENNFGNNPPVTKQDHFVIVPEVTKQRVVTDTVWKIDSTLIENKMVYDSTSEIVQNNESTAQAQASYFLVKNYLSKVNIPERYSMVSTGAVFDIFYQNKKIVLSGIYCDANYWTILDHTFLEGGPFGENEINNELQVCIINEKTRDEYFGKGEKALGQEIINEEKHYKVVGVVKNVSDDKRYAFADIYLPFTLNKQLVNLEDRDVLGGLTVLYFASSPSQREDIKAEIKGLEKSIVLEDPNFNVVTLSPMNYNEDLSRSYFYRENQAEGLYLLYLVIGGLILIFILVPTLNLINLNISRILERSSEIGVRKAFGATRNHLIYQFIFENVIISLIGGVLGFLLAGILLRILNNSNIITDADITLNLRVAIYSILTAVLFGIISGALPAMRMSKLKIVDAIKNLRV